MEERNLCSQGSYSSADQNTFSTCWCLIMIKLQSVIINRIHFNTFGAGGLEYNPPIHFCLHIDGPISGEVSLQFSEGAYMKQFTVYIHENLYST